MNETYKTAEIQFPENPADIDQSPQPKDRNQKPHIEVNTMNSGRDWQRERNDGTEQVPFLYDEAASKLFLGEDGAYHEDIINHFWPDGTRYHSEFKPGRVFLDKGTIDWYKSGGEWEPKEQSAIRDLLRKALNTPIEQKVVPDSWNDFTFSYRQDVIRILAGDWDFIEAETKTASKLEWLKTRGDKKLNTPEGQEFLKLMEDRFHNEKTDDLMPWLAREWKKGRIRTDSYPPDIGWHHHEDRGPDRSPARQTSRLTPAQLNHWGDWFGSNHPTRRGVDIMQLTPYDVSRKINGWDMDMRSQMQGPAETSGNVVHQFPDKWTIQDLREPQALNDEGDAMGHCVGGYHHTVAGNDSRIYSLRDHKNEPHATIEIEPNEFLEGDGEQRQPWEDDWTPEGGRLVQVQGKANAPPKPEYQARIKDWFNQFGNKPWWDSQYISDVDEINDDGYTAYHPGDYGLNPPDMDYSWDSIFSDMDNSGRTRHYRSDFPHDELAAHANQHGKLDELEKAFQEWSHPKVDRWSENWDDNWYSYGGGSEDAFAESEGERKPDEEDFYDLENDTTDEAAYEKELDRWQEKYQEWNDSERAYWQEHEWDQSDLGQNISAMHSAIQAQQRKEPTPPTTFSKVAHTYHRHFTTGEPCTCTFTRHLAVPVFANVWDPPSEYESPGKEDDQINWTPGQWGKGWISEQGPMHSWNTDETGSPSHWDYTDLNAPHLVPENFFLISPDGGLSDPMGRLDHERAQKVVERDPRLRNDYEEHPWSL